MKTNDLITIKKETLYTIGVLKENEPPISSLKMYEPKESDIKYLFDTDTGNFHLLPEEQDFVKISQEIRKKHEEVLEELAQLIKDDIGITLEYKKHYGYLIPSPFETRGNLFAYIRVLKNNIPYDLMFIRCYIDNNKVNVLLKSVQYSKGDGKAYRAYPESSKAFDQKKTELMYFNPDIDFHENAIDIANNFLDFVNNN